LWRRQDVLYFPDRYTGGRFPLRYAFYEDAIDFADLGPWNLDAPVAIVHGEHDELLPPEDSRELQRRIRSPSVSLDVVPGGDHRLNAAIALMCEKLDALWKLG
jgi:pimeloyl-ACP methyl ester carboxylesterase